MKRITVLAVILVLSVTVGHAQGSRRKIALCIGNTAYKYQSELPRSEAEAEQITDSLKIQGFETMLLKNGNKQQMLDTLQRFMKLASQLGKNDVSFLVYNGHGTTYKGKDYMIPVDAMIPDKNAIPETCISMTEITIELSKLTNHLNIILFDACRDLPGKNLGSTGNTVSITLEPIKDIPVTNILPNGNMFINYTTHEGYKAYENNYIPLLLKYISKKNICARDAFTQANDEFGKYNQQKPSSWQNYFGPFCFREPCNCAGGRDFKKLYLHVQDPVSGEKSKFKTELAGILLKAGYKVQSLQEKADVKINVMVTATEIAKHGPTHGGNYTYSSRAEVQVELFDSDSDLFFSKQYEETVVTTISFDYSAQKALLELSGIIAGDIIDQLKLY